MVVIWTMFCWWIKYWLKPDTEIPIYQDGSCPNMFTVLEIVEIVVCVVGSEYSFRIDSINLMLTFWIEWISSVIYCIHFWQNRKYLRKSNWECEPELSLILLTKSFGTLNRRNSSYTSPNSDCAREPKTSAKIDRRTNSNNEVVEVQFVNWVWSRM